MTDEALDERIEGADPDDLALLCYTSGTTGEPKGVMVTHRNAAFVAEISAEAYPSNKFEDRMVSYLPLNHIAEHLFTLLVPVTNGTQVYLCDDIGAITSYLGAVKPTRFLAAPRIWEKFESALPAILSPAEPPTCCRTPRWRLRSRRHWAWKNCSTRTAARPRWHPRPRNSSKPWTCRSTSPTA